MKKYYSNRKDKAERRDMYRELEVLELFAGMTEPDVIAMEQLAADFRHWLVRR